MINVQTDVLHRHTVGSANTAAASAPAISNAALIAPHATHPTPSPPHSAPPPNPLIGSVAGALDSALDVYHPNPAAQPGVRHIPLATSLRSFAVPYRSAVVRLATQLFWLVPYVFGWL